MPWNTTLFLQINASSDPGQAAMLVLGMLASGPILLAPILLTALWVWGEPKRRSALLAVAVGLFVGQGLNMLLGLIWFEPWPFMTGVGHTWIAHVADNGFPSDHAALAWSLGLGLILTGGSRRWGIAACLLGVVAGWARVYLGVHYPLDVLVAAPVGLAAGTTAFFVEPTMQARVAPLIEGLYDAVLDRVPARIPLPRRTRP